MGNLAADRENSPDRDSAAGSRSAKSTSGSAAGRRRKRPGPGNPGKRGTETEIEERVIGVARLLAKRVHLHQIKQFLWTKYDLGPRMAVRYIAKARQWMFDQIGRPREELVAEAVGYYEEILRDPEANPRRKDDAQLALRQLLGLDMPFKIAPTTPDGASCYVPQNVLAEMSDEELAVLRRLHHRVQKQLLIDGGQAAATNGDGTTVDVK